MNYNIKRNISAGKRLFAPGVQKPIYLLNFVTSRCSAACDHCFYWRELNTKGNEELSVEEHRKIASSLGPMLQITFTGGSPELRVDLPEIVYEYYNYCRPSHMTFCMLGFSTKLVIEHMTKILERCKEQLITVSFSLDGLEEEHNKYRNLKGLFDKEINTIQELHKLRNTYSNLRIDIGMVVHGLNIGTVMDTALWVKKNLPVDKLKPILVRGNTLNPDTRDNKCIDVYEQIVDQNNNWLMSKTQGKMNFKDKIIRAKEHVQRDVIKQISQTNSSPLTCSGGRETAVLYPNGNVAGCEMRSDVLGNLRNYDYNLGTVWFSEQARNFRKTSGKSKECVGCYHHCFISPAIFRTPSMWLKIANSIMKLNN